MTIVSYPHAIRLRAPWEVAGHAEVDSVAEPHWQRIESPHDWSTALGADFQGTVRLRRFFNRPGQLDLNERLWLVLDDVAAPINVRLNGLDWPTIEHPGTFERDMTAELRSRNTLEIRLDTVGSPAGGGLSAVRLEIRLAD